MRDPVHDDFTQVFLRERRCHASGRQCTHDECATYRRRDLVFTFHCLRPPANGMTVLWFVELTSQQKLENHRGEIDTVFPPLWMAAS